MSSAPQKVEISLKIARELATAISALDGAPKIIGKGDKEQVIFIPYKFKGNMRVGIARNRHALRPLIDAYETEHTRIFKELAPDGEGFDNTDPRKVKYDEMMKPTLDEVHTLDLVKFTFEELDLDTNEIPNAVIEALWPIIAQ